MSFSLVTVTSEMCSFWGVFAFLFFNPAWGFELQIFHTNDMHSRFEETSSSSGECKANKTCFGGFARVAHYVKQHRKNNTIFLNAGDSFQGTPLFVLFGTEVLLPLINLLGIDAMSLGNHEFDRGPKVLKDYLDKVNTSVVTCNVDGSKDKDFTNTKLKKSVILNVGPVKVGVVGYLTNETNMLSQVRNVTLTEEIVCIKEEAKKLKDQKVPIVIAVGHSGWEKDQEIAKEVEEVDVVIGGHTNTFVYTGTQPCTEKPEDVYPKMVTQKSGKKVPVVQAYAYTKYIGVLNLVFDSNYTLINATGNPVLMTKNIEKDKKITELLKPFQTKMSEVYDKIICKLEVNLNSSCLVRECNMGNLFAGAASEFVEKNNTANLNKQFFTIALINGGTFRSSLNKSELKDGQMAMRDLIKIIPHLNYFVQIKLEGGTLLEILKYSYSQRNTGGFLQMSQMKVIYYKNNSSVDAFVTRRKDNEVVKVILNRNYDVVISDYLYNGGDGYKHFKNGTLIKFYQAPEGTSIVKDWMTANSPINVTVTGRIKFK